MPLTIYLSSPVEPSGASWLINCFLELGIKVSHKPVVDNVWRHVDPIAPPDYLWRRARDGSHRLHPRAQVLKKWLPVLSRKESFFFREDVEIVYVQDLPTSLQLDNPVLLFVRDPRDSMYSMYRRMRPALDYEAFLRFPDPDTLLDRPTHWRLFVESWLALANDNCFTFEEYKRSAVVLLQRIMERVHVSCDAAEIERAVLESSFAKARAAEERYRTEFPGDWEVANRTGSVGDWIERADARGGAAEIESRAASVMRRLGYDCPATTREVHSIRPALARCVQVFSKIHMPESVAALLASDQDEDRSIDDTLAFAFGLDEQFLRRTNLPSHRIRRLLDNLAHVASNRGTECAERINELRGYFDEGSEYQFAQMRDLLIRRRGAKENGT